MLTVKNISLVRVVVIGKVLDPGKSLNTEVTALVGDVYIKLVNLMVAKYVRVTDGNVVLSPSDLSVIVTSETFANSERPPASRYPKGYRIWNDTEKAPNYSNGVDMWHNAFGAET